jgi:hypothetical protein
VQFANAHDWPPQVVDAMPAWLVDEWWHLNAFLEEVARERSRGPSPADGAQSQ